MIDNNVDKKQWKVGSASNSKKTYTINETEEGKFECDCPAWKFRKDLDRDCKHIIAIKKMLTNKV